MQSNTWNFLKIWSHLILKVINFQMNTYNQLCEYFYSVSSMKMFFFLLPYGAKKKIIRLNQPYPQKWYHVCFGWWWKTATFILMKRTKSCPNQNWGEMYNTLTCCACVRMCFSRLEWIKIKRTRKNEPNITETDKINGSQMSVVRSPSLRSILFIALK